MPILGDDNLCNSDAENMFHTPEDQFKNVNAVIDECNYIKEVLTVEPEICALDLKFNCELGP